VMMMMHCGGYNDMVVVVGAVIVVA
jgi:hypothetical protein